MHVTFLLLEEKSVAVRRLTAVAASLALAAGAALAAAPAGKAATHASPGTRSPAKVLLSDGNRFDYNSGARNAWSVGTKHSG